MFVSLSVSDILFKFVVTKLRISERNTKENEFFFLFPNGSKFDRITKLRISERNTKENRLFFLFPNGSKFDIISKLRISERNNKYK